MVKTLYVGNIPWSVTENELRALFSDYGEVHACRIITEKATGRSKGYGFIEVDETFVDEIIAKTNGLEVNGRRIVVNEARPRDEE